jgi:hypothetical protein
MAHRPGPPGEVVYSPVGCDLKHYPDQVDVCLVEGGVANQDNLELAHQVRRRTKILISFGDCAVTANVPGMRNLLGGRPGAEAGLPGAGRQRCPTAPRPRHCAGTAGSGAALASSDPIDILHARLSRPSRSHQSHPGTLAPGESPDMVWARNDQIWVGKEANSAINSKLKIQNSTPQCPSLSPTPPSPTLPIPIPIPSHYPYTHHAPRSP